MNIKAISLGIISSILLNKYRNDCISSVLLLSGLSYNMTDQLVQILAPLTLKAGRSGRDLNKKG